MERMASLNLGSLELVLAAENAILDFLDASIALLTFCACSYHCQRCPNIIQVIYSHFNEEDL